MGRIIPGGPAHQDGRLQIGDEITHVNGQSLYGATHQDVISLISNSSINRSIMLRVIRPRDVGEFHMIVSSKAIRLSQSNYILTTYLVFRNANRSVPVIHRTACSNTGETTRREFRVCDTVQWNGRLYHKLVVKWIID